MITHVNGEQPFQVLTSSFSISPSNEGYTLQISADGRQYSNLFTVGAGVTRLVTGVAANSYYRLLGNQSEVIVNWMKTCVTEGGSGSGTELQPVSEFPLDAPEGTVVAYTGSSSASGVYQYNGTDWTPVGVDDLSDYYTSAQTEDAISNAVSGLATEEYVDSALTELHNTFADYTPTSGFSTINGSAITEGGDLVIEGGGSTEETELPIAAAIIDTRNEIFATLNQKYLLKTRIYEMLAEKTGANETDSQIKTYVDPLIDVIYGLIEDKELVISAAINDLNEKTVKSDTVSSIWRGTQAEYDAIVIKDPNTFYVIINN